MVVNRSNSILVESLCPFPHLFLQGVFVFIFLSLSASPLSVGFTFLVHVTYTLDRPWRRTLPSRDDLPSGSQRGDGPDSPMDSN